MDVPSRRPSTPSFPPPTDRVLAPPRKGAWRLRGERGAGRVAATSLALAVILAAAAPAAAAPADSDGERTSIQIERSQGRALTRPVALRFVAFGEEHEVLLERHHGLIAPGARLVRVGEDGDRRDEDLVATQWVGRIEGEPASLARVDIDGDEIRGYLRTASGTIVLEPAAEQGMHLVRRAEDVLEGADLPCDGAPLAPLGEDLAGATSPRAPRMATTDANAVSLRAMDVSVVADADFFARFGSRSAEHIQALFNQVDGVFQADLGLTLRIRQLVIYESAATQPFTATGSPLETLYQLSAARSGSSSESIGAGAVTHLLVGRSLSGAIGIAWVSGVCDAYYGAGLSQVTSVPGYREAILVAHELGHNVGAMHDGQAGSYCESTPYGWIMWPTISSGLDDSFSSCSRSRIALTTGRVDCLGSAIPENCGDGVLDPGEECDDGNNNGGDCCRSNCTYDLAGMSCGATGSACLDAVCDGAGSCLQVPNAATCNAGDACTVALCSNGNCVAGEELRGFTRFLAKFKIGKDGMVAGAKISGTMALQELGSDPAGAGVHLRAAMGYAMGYDQIVPATAWMQKKPGTYFHKTKDGTPGTIRSARIRFAPLSGLVAFRLVMNAPVASMEPAAPEVFLLAGDRPDGQCASARIPNCRRRGSSYVCQ